MFVNPSWSPILSASNSVDLYQSDILDEFSLILILILSRFSKKMSAYVPRSLSHSESLSKIESRSSSSLLPILEHVQKILERPSISTFIEEVKGQ